MFAVDASDLPCHVLGKNFVFDKVKSSHMRAAQEHQIYQQHHPNHNLFLNKILVTNNAPRSTPPASIIPTPLSNNHYGVNSAYISSRLQKRFHEAVQYQCCGPRQTDTNASLLDWGVVYCGIGLRLNSHTKLDDSSDYPFDRRFVFGCGTVRWNCTY
jgi:hypothetical protein